MGSFNVACSVSKISINCGDEIAYFPLEISKYPYKIGDKNDMLIYQHCFYCPVSLPIFGEYDDYGGIEDIEQNENVDILQKKYKMKIDKLIREKPEPISSGMFVLKDIYKFLVKNQVDEWGKRKGTFVYNREKLYRQYEKWKKTLIEDNALKMVSTDWSNFSFRDYPAFSETYRPQIIQGKLKRELVDFTLFLCSMYALNTFFFPAMNGYQCGNKYASKDLFRECLKILRR